MCGLEAKTTSNVDVLCGIDTLPLPLVKFKPCEITELPPFRVSCTVGETTFQQGVQMPLPLNEAVNMCSLI